MSEPLRPLDWKPADQTTEKTIDAFFRFRERVMNRRPPYPIERVRGWLRALNAMDSDVRYEKTPERFLVDDFHNEFFAFHFADGIDPGTDNHCWNLWIYPTLREKTRRALCSFYDCSPVPELEMWK